MSIQFLQSLIPNENQTIRVNDCIVRGNLTGLNSGSFTGNLGTNEVMTANRMTFSGTGTDIGKITLPELTIYTQLTSETTPVTITGAEQQFKINTAVGSNFNPSTTRLFNVNHTGVDENTMVLVSRAGSIGTNQQLLTWVAYTSSGLIRIALHNLSTIVASGQETIIVKLIQSI
tara:strand:- start:38 stop:559 length:522 start_codon:yes stop_codon:yes gene_type:complete